MPNVVNNVRELATAAIANGQTTSGAIAQRGDACLVALVMPASFTGSSVSFTSSLSESGTYQAVQLDGEDISVEVAGGKNVSLTTGQIAALMAWSWIKIVSSSTEGADRSIGLVMRPL